MEHFVWLMEASIKEIQGKLQTGEVTSKELVFAYLHRIGEFDQAGPAINSILEINPQAVHIAEAMDYERKEKGVRGPLHGIPLVIKDNIDTADKMHTSAGSLVLAEAYAGTDAHLVSLLREAGAIILGKTNMTEWANYMTENMPSGYSSRGGQVRNPYGEGFTVGGSSSGSGAAIACNFAAASVGTETSGSILSPASQNGIVGIKPTVGLISRNGLIPISHSQDTAGPMARTVEDAVLLLQVLQGEDERDPVTRKNPLQLVNFSDHLKKDGLQNKRIGIARNPYFDELSSSYLKVMEEAIDELTRNGAEVIEDIRIRHADFEWDNKVMLYEFKNDLNAYLNTVDPKHGIHSLSDVIKKNEEIGEAALKYGQKILVKAEATSGNLTEADYLNSLLRDSELASRQGIDAAIKENRLDALVFPGYLGSMMPAKAGYPSITVPAGFTDIGEPIGITFSSTAFSEPVLIEIAYGYEQHTYKRRPPKL